MIYCFDIDGTICTNTNGHYDPALPYPERIAQINKLYESGETMSLYCADQQLELIGASLLNHNLLNGI